MSPFERATRVQIGAWQGAKLSLSFALAYIFYLLFGEFGTGFNISPLSWLSSASRPIYTLEEYLTVLQNILGSLPMFIIGGMIIGGIPALIIGVLSGAGIAALLSYPATTPDTKTRLLVGAVFSSSVVLMLSLAMSVLVSGAALSSSLLIFIGLPSLVYMGSCLWLSYRIPTLPE